MKRIGDPQSEEELQAFWVRCIQLSRNQRLFYRPH